MRLFCAGRGRDAARDRHGRHGVERVGELGEEETATVATRQMQESAKNANISSPLPDTNAAEDLKKAAHLLSGFVDKEENEAGFDNIIPPEILRKARGLAIYTVVKAVS